MERSGTTLPAAAYGAAFTLVEMLAAMAIVSMLMVAALAVTGRLARLAEAGEATDARDHLAASLERALAADATHARRYGTVTGDDTSGIGDGYVLQTFSAVSGKDARVRHLPVLVTWRIREIDGASWLVRTQRADASRKEHTELIAAGVVNIHVGPASGGSLDLPAGPSTPAPEVLVVTVQLAGENNYAQFRYRTR